MTQNANMYEDMKLILARLRDYDNCDDYDIDEGANCLEKLISDISTAKIELVIKTDELNDFKDKLSILCKQREEYIWKLCMSEGETKRLKMAVRALLDDVNKRYPSKHPREWTCPYMAELDRLAPPNADATD
jgi:hypothetical protein